MHISTHSYPWRQIEVSGEFYDPVAVPPGNLSLCIRPLLSAVTTNHKMAAVHGSEIYKVVQI
jgi:hypothetical protein